MLSFRLFIRRYRNSRFVFAFISLFLFLWIFNAFRSASSEIRMSVTSYTRVTTTSSPGNTTNTPLNIGVEDNANLQGIYLQHGYRVSHDEVRFVFVTDVTNPTSIEYLLNDEWLPIRSRCFHRNCEQILNCTIIGHLGTILLPESIRAKPFPRVYVRASGSQDNFHLMEVKDVRPPKDGNFKHALGVFLQPIYFNSDWSVFVQFFESWIAHGSTKFYVYYNSFSKQVSDVLQFYKDVLGPNLELIPWSDFPVPVRDYGNFFKDPNTRVYRAEVLSAINDCVLRSRNEVKWLATLDLDDFPFTSLHNLSFILQKYDKIYPDISHMMIPWRYAQYKVNFNVDRLSDIKFDWLKEVYQLESEFVFGSYATARKLILQPARVYITEIHHLLEAENMTTVSNRTYTGMTLHEFHAKSMHLRRYQSSPFFNTTAWNSKIPINFMSEFANRMTENFEKRARNHRIYDSQMSPWAEEFLQSVRDMERCKNWGINDVDPQDYTITLCRSLRGCEKLLANAKHFIRAPQIWRNIHDNFHLTVYSYT